LHQLHQREVAAVFQPPHVHSGTRRVQKGRHSMGVHWFWYGLASLHRFNREGKLTST